MASNSKCRLAGCGTFFGAEKQQAATWRCFPALQRIIILRPCAQVVLTFDTVALTQTSYGKTDQEI